jgi:hypothetical protein
MLPMGVPVLRVLRSQGLIANDLQVLGVFLLGSFRKIETPRDDGFAINAHYLIM